MPKLSTKFLFFPIIMFFSIFSLEPLPPLLAQSDSVTNERIPVKARQLEEHWNVDCAGVLKKAAHVPANGSDKAIQKNQLRSDIKKCIYIYNTPDSAHFKAEPDYTELLDKLSQLPD